MNGITPIYSNTLYMTYCPMFKRCLMFYKNWSPFYDV